MLRKRKLYCFLRRLKKFNSVRTNLLSSIANQPLKSVPSEDITKLKWESVVGLEIHAQINAKSKLFSKSGTTFGVPTNAQVSYFDAAIPGTYPHLNKYCVEAGVLTALALNCTVNKTSTFDRKHYFYPDLPAGYQITQQAQPLANNGFVDFVVHDTNQKIEPYSCRAKLKQLQLEQDSGRSFHMDSGNTLIDFNRAGIGLMELVFEPDLKNGAEAAMLVKELILILTRLGTCNCIMEEGALRVDANISVNRIGAPWGVRTEVKNINSLRYVAKAIDYEIKRQIETLESGGYITNETRSFDFKTKQTVFMRDKENFQDYRFVPEPDLPPLQLCDDSDKVVVQESAHTLNIDDLKRKMPQLPSEERQHLIKTYDISYENADRIVQEEGLKEFYEAVAVGGYDNAYTITFLLNDVQREMKSRNESYKDCSVSSNQVKDIIELVDKNIISDATADDILEMFFNGDTRSAKEIVEAYNWFLIIDEKELETICHKVILGNIGLVQKYRKKKQRRHMTALLIILNELVNNRAHIKTAEAVFIRLIYNPANVKSSEEKCV